MMVLSDFDPATGHRRDCAYPGGTCDSDCANALYSAHVRMEDILIEWDRLTKTPGPTTITMRAARDGRA